MDEYKKWLMQMQRLCSTKEYCRFDIYEKLKKSELNDNDKKKIIETLVNQNFINEQRYVRAFIHDKLFLSKWGLTKIKYVLQQKNIDIELLNNFLYEVDEEKYLESFLGLAKAKWKSLKDNDPYLQKQKLIRYLMGRGVEYKIAEKIYDLLK